MVNVAIFFAGAFFGVASVFLWALAAGGKKRDKPEDKAGAEKE